MAKRPCRNPSEPCQHAIKPGAASTAKVKHMTKAPKEDAMHAKPLIFAALIAAFGLSACAPQATPTTQTAHNPLPTAPPVVVTQIVNGNPQGVVVTATPLSIVEAPNATSAPAATS